jgi:type I restriction enzyme, S subunit
MKMINPQKYAAYKNSGVEWIEEVPAHWEVKKFKRVFYEVKKRSNSVLNCGSISFGKVVYKDDEKIPESTKRSYQVVLKGDFLVNPLNLNYDLISLRIALSEIDVVVSSGYIVLSNSVKLDKTYYKYFLHRFDVAFMKLLGSGVRQTLNYNDIANCDLVFPPLSEQTAIAQFLDNKTALIDQAIGIKQKQIELLKERRQILIHKVVTRGLNPNVKMKDSGVEWIGEVPEGWVRSKLGHYATVNNGSTPSRVNPNYWNGNICWLSSSKVNELVVNTTSEYITERAVKDCSLRIFPKLTIIMGIVGQGKTRGTTSILNIVSTINQNMVGIIPNTNVNPKYLHNFLVQGYNFIRRGNGSNQEAMNCEIVKQINIIIPPKQEQVKIVEYIEIASTKIATVISLKEQEIEKLKEYKAALINSAVTGKVKVG